MRKLLGALYSQICPAFFRATHLSSFYLILFSFKDAKVVLKDNSLCACLSNLFDDEADDAGGSSEDNGSSVSCGGSSDGDNDSTGGSGGGHAVMVALILKSFPSYARAEEHILSALIPSFSVSPRPPLAHLLADLRNKSPSHSLILFLSSPGTSCLLLPLSLGTSLAHIIFDITLC